MSEVGGVVRQAPLDRRDRAAGMPSSAALSDAQTRNAPLAVAEPERLRSRAGRGLLTVEGLVIGVLGGVALASSMGYARFDADGMPMLGLKVTPPHAALLLIAGTLALLACLGRRTALIFSGLTAFGWAVLAVVCTLKAAHHAPGVLGFDPRDSFLYGALSAYNLMTLALLVFAVVKTRRQA